MLSNLQRYYRPKSISEALALLQKNSGTILIISGGTKLVLSQNDTVHELVDISSLKLNYIKEDMGVVRVGSTSPLQKIIDHPTIKKLYGGILCEATRLTHRSRMLRNCSTIGGELVTTNSLSVLYCALLVLQAQVRIAGGEEFALAMNIFLNKKTLAGGLLMEILVPHLKRDTYTGIAPISTDGKSSPLICACVRLSLQNGVCKNVKIALTGTEKVPQRFQNAETLLEDRKLTSGNIELAADAVYKSIKPISDNLASQEFRKEVSRLVVKKALNQCLESAEDESMGLANR